MVDISDILNKTTSAIDKWYERNQRVSYNKYLAMSDLGEGCSRKLWYKFRNYMPKEPIQGRIQRIFDTGNEQEKRVVTALQGIALVGNCQARVEACEGHLQGAIDLEIMGLVEAPKTLHIGEVKSHNDKNFKEVAKEGVKVGFFKHWVQMHVYGQLRGLTRYFYLAVNKNDEALYQERGEVDSVLATAQIARAQRIIDAKEPPTRIAEYDSYECRFCQFKEICHKGAPHDINLRNDGTHKPGPGGIWVKI